MSTLALDGSSRAGSGPGDLVARNLDLLVLGIALPVFAATGLPILGYVAMAVGWLAQRLVQALVRRRLAASSDRATALGLVGGSMVLRLWLVTLPVLAVGIAAGDDVGLAAAIMAATLVTVSLVGEGLRRALRSGR